MTHRCFAIVDIETTGSTAAPGHITDIAIVRFSIGGTAREWSSLVRPVVPIPRHITRLTGIDDPMVRHAPVFAAIAADVDALTRDAIFVAHNAAFDYHFLRAAFRGEGHDFVRDRLCTVQLSRRYTPERSPHSLDAVVDRHHLGAALAGADRHRALGDARLVHAFLEHVRHDLGDLAFDQLVQRLTLTSARAVPSAPTRVGD